MRRRVVLCALGASVLTGGCGTRSEPASRESPEPQSRAVITDSAQVGGANLQLLEIGPQCLVRFAAAPQDQLALVPKPPCYFVRRGSSLPQTFSYPEVAVQSVLIVVGSPASETTRKRWGLTSQMVCGEETQGVLVKRERIVVTRRVTRGGVACRDAGVDEKEFWTFAHENE